MPERASGAPTGPDTRTASGDSTAPDQRPDFIDAWLESKVTETGRHTKVLLTERKDVRAEIADQLAEVVRQHYVSPRVAAKRLAELGAQKTATLLAEELPVTRRARSADLGEILATEFVDQQLDFEVPICRLRWKDGREMALRGDDLVGLGRSDRNRKERFLKGESKSRARMPAGVVAQAGAALNRDRGRPSRHSVLFVAKRLRERGDDTLALLLERAVLDGFRGAEIEHLLFGFCGNNPDRQLGAYLEDNRTRKWPRHAVGLRVRDHGDFIRTLYESL